jgi:D-lactate dehydrogenase (cytochrome)
MNLFFFFFFGPVNQYAGFNPPYEEKPTIFFKFSGSTAKVDDDVRAVSDLIKPYGAGPFVWAQDQQTRDKIWEARKGALWGCMSYRPGAEVWTTDVCVPISRLAECVELTKQDLQTYNVPAAVVGHVGDGNFHVLMMVKPDDKEEMKRAAMVNDRMVQR